MILNSYSNKSKGFTIMEAIVAISVIVIGVIGSFILITFTISASSLASQKLVAFYLAQEGIEIVRNIRDTNWLLDADWDNGLVVGNSYEADYTDLFLDLYTGRFLYLDSANGYSYNVAGSRTPYKRKITISNGPISGSSLNIKVDISWQARGRPYTVSVQENLYDWLK